MAAPSLTYSYTSGTLAASAQVNQNFNDLLNGYTTYSYALKCGTLNGLTLTPPATGATLTLADGKTFTVSNTLTFTGTDSSSVAFGTGGTAAYTANKLSAFAATTSAELAGVISDETGSGALVFATSPTFTTPILGTPTSGTLTNCTLPVGGITGLAAGVATFLATPSSANLIAACSDETGTGALVFATSPSLVTPLLGTPTSGNLSNCTALPAASVTGTLGADHGGTGVANNASSTLTISGNFGTTLTVAGATSITLPSSGTMATLAGTETFTNKTLTSPKINENVALTTTATKLNLLTSAGGTTGTTSTNIVFDTSPTLVTPTIGVATATSINKVTITAPATSAILTIANSKTLTVNNTVTLTGTDTSTLTFGAGGTIAYTDGLTRIRLHTSNGYGATSTKIRRFTTTVVNSGTGVTYADDANLGTTLTVNVAGIYAISYCDNFTGGDQMGLSLNSSELTTAILNITAADRLVSSGTSASGDVELVSWTGYLAANDVIRPHTGGAAASSTARITISMFRLS